MKRVFRTFKNLFVLASMLLAIFVLIHDFILLGIAPAFTHEFYCITYFGLLVDLCAYIVIKMSGMYFEELFK